MKYERRKAMKERLYKNNKKRTKKSRNRLATAIVKVTISEGTFQKKVLFASNRGFVP